MKNPGVAAVLSFFLPGLGQIYNGQILKGLIFMGIQVINGLLMMIVIGLITYPLFWILSIYDAYAVAQRQNPGAFRP